MESNMPENEIMRTKEDLKVARQNMRKELRRLEREWWDNILTQCQEANEKGEMGTMYRILRQLGSRDSKPNTGTTITTAEFKAHFEKVSKERYEVEPNTHEVGS